MNATTTSRLQEAVESLTTHTHTCLIYSDRTEQFAAAIPYMKKGLNNNERCIYITDDNSVAVVKKDMKRQGIDFDEAVETGSLKMATKDQSYLKHGTFDPDAMLGLVKNSVADAEQKGFSSLRVTGEMTWALGPQVDDAKLLEYETKLNEFFPRHNCSAICQYNIKRFSAEIIRDILYTHPIAIVGGVVCKNFYYKPPEILNSTDNAELEVDRMIKNIYEFEQREIQLRAQKQKLEDVNEILEEKVHERTQHLKKKADELKELNKQMIGRADRIRQLENMNQQLSSRISQLREETDHNAIEV